MNPLSKRIRVARSFRNYSQEFMAEELKISQSTYSRIETGSITPDIDRLKHIARLLSMKLDYFLIEDDAQLFSSFTVD